MLFQIDFNNHALDGFVVFNRFSNFPRSVSSKVDYLVVGIEDSNLVKDKNGGKSRKILEAEELRANGGEIKIISGEYIIRHLC